MLRTEREPGVVPVHQELLDIARLICIQQGGPGIRNLDWRSTVGFEPEIDLIVDLKRPLEKNRVVIQYAIFTALFEPNAAQLRISYDWKRNFNLENDPFSIMILDAFRQYPASELAQVKRRRRQSVYTA